MDTSLVGECRETGNVVVEGDVALDSFADEILNLLELVELILALDILGVGDDHASHKTAERGDAVTLADAEHGGVDVGSTSFKSTVCVRDGHASVVVEVDLDVTRHNATEGTDEIVHLARVRATDSVSDTNAVDTNAVNCLVDGKEVDEV